jgi:hypothetical protein
MHGHNHQHPVGSAQMPIMLDDQDDIMVISDDDNVVVISSDEEPDNVLHVCLIIYTTPLLNKRL